MAEPIRIGNHHQLFLDGVLIEWRDKVTRSVCPVSKCPENPVIRPESVWEPAGYLARSVIYDEEERIYKAWCSGVRSQSCVFYFASKDGIHWERPSLDVVAIDSRPTNVVVPSSHSRHERRFPGFHELFGVSKDEFDSSPARRYKMGYLYLIRDYHGADEDPFHPGEHRGLGVAFSHDGIHWTPMDDAVTQATCDGATHWFYNENTGRYVLYGRTKHIAPDVRALYGESLFFQRHNWGRAVRRAESEDFVHWVPDKGELVLAADVLDGPGDEIYGMNVFPYEGIYIGFVQMFHNYEDRVYLDIQLAVSRDSVHFQRLSDRSPFIPAGGVGEWDRFNISAANSPPIRLGDELRFYYGGRNYLHSGAYKGPDGGSGAGVGFGSIKIDRFAAMESTFDPGKLMTKPFILQGKQLHLNANARFGCINVALLDEKGDSIERMRARVEGLDAVDIPVPMEGLGSLSDRPLRIEFTIRNSQLFSFWFD